MPHNDPTKTAAHPAGGADPSPTVTGGELDAAATSDRDWRENDVAAPPASAGRYVLGEEIARGGMGEVYRATDTVLNREVAVKVLQAKYGPESGSAHRFADEARITGQLQHPAIPPVHDLGTLPDGRPFLAMKLIKGQTLDDLLKARPDPSADRGRFVAVFEAVCQAVAYAHAHEVIHRDLKPANVMVGAFAEVQVMDWGLAKVLSNRGSPAADPNETVGGTEVVSLRDSDGSFTQAGSVLGTPAFMPPEQAIGAVGTIDRRSDVFGLGAILAVILTGRPPFVASTAETTRVKAAQGDVAECFSKLDECGADPELVALCKRCLAPKQDDRPSNAGEVASAVAEHRTAADERIRQLELDVVKAAEQRKRRRTQFVLAAVAVGLLAAVGVFVFELRKQAERQRAEEARHAEEVRAERVRAALDRAALEAMSGRFDQAREALADAEQNGASPADIHFLRAVLTFHTDDLLGTVREIERVLVLTPDHVAARALLAAALNAAGDTAGFERELRACLQSTPTTAEDFLFRGYARVYHQPAAALADIDESIRRRPSVLATLMRVDALTSLAEQTGDPGTATEAVQAAVLARQMLPHDPQRLGLLVLARTVGYTAHRAAGKESETAVIRKQLEADTRELEAVQLPTAYWVRGLSRHVMGDRTALNRLADEIERLPIDKVDSWLGEVFAVTRYRQGKVAEALAVLDKSPDRDIRNMYVNRILLMLAADGANRERAVREFRRVVALPQKSPMSVWELGVLCHCGELDEATTMARAMKATGWKPPPNSYPEFLPAVLDYHCGEVTEERLFELAKGARDNLAWAHWAVGNVKLAQKQFKAAAAHFRAFEQSGVVLLAGTHWVSLWADKLEQDTAWPPWIRGKTK